jgi:Alw26I/Eco31I/Esp3I family type II restriction endonuclease
MNSKIDRSWHENFIKYTEFIVDQPQYKGLYFDRSPKGQIKWVVAGKSDKGLIRRNWWNNKCEEFGVEIKAGCYAKIAVILHPTKEHTCQICGKSLSIYYVYPNANLLTKIRKLFNYNIKPFSLSIYDIIDRIPNKINNWKTIFKIRNNKEIQDYQSLKDWLKINHVQKSMKSFFSPGVMSNSPDRFDGFHSDGNCCRSVSDKGRHKSNLQRYGQDRRVYENWADGNWKMADRLMSCFRKFGVSADHIGPISLGFCHRPRFQPLTKSQNSAKNNRMNYNDVKILIDDEKSNQVVSWHSKYIWDELKNKIKNDHDAIKLSNLMRKNMHHVLIIFSMISESGNNEFLTQFLNPQYSFADYEFIGFDPKTGNYKKVKSKNLTGKNQQNNNDRYFRIAFEKLEEYKDINNRRVNIWQNRAIDKKLSALIELLNQSKTDEAKEKLKDIFSQLSKDASLAW